MVAACSDKDDEEEECPDTDENNAEVETSGREDVDADDPAGDRERRRGERERRRGDRSRSRG